MTPGAGTGARVLAIDGGGSKTDVALVARDGSVLARGRGPAFLPWVVGVPRAVDAAAEAVRLALGPAAAPPYAEHVAAYVTGADLPVEEEALRAEFAARGFGPSLTVGNDTFALLRAGARAGWGVAVVCGAGINCVGVGPAGRVARFPALGRISGDWGGGQELGEEALWHAVRAEDGRGAPTALLDAVRGHFGAARAEDVSRAIHLGELPRERLHELAPRVLALARHDPAARALAGRLAEEIALLGSAALRRLGLLDAPAEVVLGGGVLTARDPLLMAAIESRYAARAPRASLVIADAPPVVGAALLGLDHLAAPPEAAARLRAAFT
ncbi:N-acetylglucosamine kinase [Bailinhaonella thermotolerans]|uniref:ATPase n=1 Tax=Bailinhaonella thermotolerans TaxID=1070861 RepID=A0A3A4BUY3_9ACTN|nr:BadF/BadG/BcrA/BcrD ATPase family protein [Bailinhaonella thermotolerans]RJL35398.1 ATPase [Bailinhaonella thermotolerans]